MTRCSFCNKPAVEFKVSYDEPTDDVDMGKATLDLLSDRAANSDTAEEDGHYLISGYCSPVCFGLQLELDEAIASE